MGVPERHVARGKADTGGGRTVATEGPGAGSLARASILASYLGGPRLHGHSPRRRIVFGRCRGVCLRQSSEISAATDSEEASTVEGHPGGSCCGRAAWPSSRGRQGDVCTRRGLRGKPLQRGRCQPHWSMWQAALNADALVGTIFGGERDRMTPWGRLGVFRGLGFRGLGV